MVEAVDVVVIGMGPGGEEVAGALAEAGLKVVGVEKELVGGECPYWGCVPSKMMIRGADLLAEGRRIPGVSGTSTVRADWAPIATRIRDQATDNWDDRVAVERFEKKGGRFVRGLGRIVRPGVVDVDGHEFAARRGIVISTGTSAAIPPIPGLGEVGYWTNRDAVAVEHLPTSLAVLGGGAIGLELAQVFARFGVRVTVIELFDHLLFMEEPEAGEELQKVFVAEGVDVRVGTETTSVATRGDQVVLGFGDGTELSADKLLVATGRRANLADIGLESVGLDPTARFVPVDDNLRAAEAVWAVGDVTGKGLFTHVAMYQAAIVTAAILGKPHPAADYRSLPRVTFTDPEVGAAGLTEKQAREAGFKVRTGLGSVPSSARGWIHGPGNEGFHKLVEDAERGVLVGGTSMGPRGGEVMSFLQLAIQEEIPTERLRHMIYAYPTFYRGIEDALRDLAKT